MSYETYARRTLCQHTAPEAPGPETGGDAMPLGEWVSPQGRTVQSVGTPVEPVHSRYSLKDATSPTGDGCAIRPNRYALAAGIHGPWCWTMPEVWSFPNWIPGDCEDPFAEYV